MFVRVALLACASLLGFASATSAAPMPIDFAARLFGARPSGFAPDLSPNGDKLIYLAAGPGASTIARIEDIATNSDRVLVQSTREAGATLRVRLRERAVGGVPLWRRDEFGRVRLSRRAHCCRRHCQRDNSSSWRSPSRRRRFLPAVRRPYHRLAAGRAGYNSDAAELPRGERQSGADRRRPNPDQSVQGEFRRTGHCS